MYADYEFEGNPYNTLRGIIKEYNEFVVREQLHESWKVPVSKKPMKQLIREFKEKVDEFIDKIITLDDLPERPKELYLSIKVNSKRFIKLYPDTYGFLLPHMSGPATKLYLAFKLYVKQEKGLDFATSFVGRKRLAETLGLSTKTIDKYIKELKGHNLIENKAPKGSRKNDWIIR